MKIFFEKISLQTKKVEELIKINQYVEDTVEKSGIKNGLVTINSLHTTAGITVNEGVECVQEDVLAFLEKLAPKEGNYRHARYLDPWGGSAANAETHLRNMLIGVSEAFPLENGKIVKGGLQTIYFVEFDGPSLRKFTVHVMGE